MNLSIQDELQPFAEELQRYVTPVFLEELAYFQWEKLHLSAIKDLYNNEIVAYHISHRHDIQLVIDTLNKEKKQRNVQGILLHSDQGSQYTSRQYNDFLKKHKMKASMSRKTNCWDNACMENFFSHFKA